MTFYRYIRLDHIGTVWASGFDLTPLGGPHGHYSMLGEFMCQSGRNPVDGHFRPIAGLTAREYQNKEAGERANAQPGNGQGGESTMTRNDTSSIIPERNCPGDGSHKLKLLDLFSGIGGFSLGLERSGGFETVAFCEIDPFCRRVLKKHWPKVPQYEDIKLVSRDRLAADGIRVNAICGGFPCQDISAAGKRKGIDGARSGLWSEYARIIREIRPEFIIVENVARLLADGMGRVLGDLSSLGYDAQWDVVPASDLGSPHRRDRVWIVAYPPERVRHRIFVPGEVHAKNFAERFKRVRSVLSARRARVRPPADFGRLHKDDGISARLDEIAALGNAVVPQIPELIGRAIMAHNFRGME